MKPAGFTAKNLLGFTTVNRGAQNFGAEYIQRSTEVKMPTEYSTVRNTNYNVGLDGAC